MSNRKGASYGSLRLDVEQSRRMSEMTIAYYDRMAEAYWDVTRDHDVSQNYTALLDAIENNPPYSILDLGCGRNRLGVAVVVLVRCSGSTGLSSSSSPSHHCCRRIWPFGIRAC